VGRFAAVVVDQDHEIIQIRSLEKDRPAQFMSRDIIDYKHLDADRSGGVCSATSSEEHTELWLAEMESSWPPPPDAVWSRKLLRRGVSAASTPAFLPERPDHVWLEGRERVRLRSFDPATGKIAAPLPAVRALSARLYLLRTGKYLYYQVKRDGLWRVWRVGIDGAGAIPITPGPYDGQPMLSG
jgi:hypothetical protein